MVYNFVLSVCLVANVRAAYEQIQSCVGTFAIFFLLSFQNRPNQSQQVPPSSVLSNKPGQINLEKSQPSPCMVNPIVLQLNYDNMLTPPNVKQDTLGL